MQNLSKRLRMHRILLVLVLETIYLLFAWVFGADEATEAVRVVVAVSLSHAALVDVVAALVVANATWNLVDHLLQL